MKQPRTVNGVVSRGSTKSDAPGASRSETGATSPESTSGRINSKWVWHYRVLKRLREKLLYARGQRLAEAAQPLEPHSMDAADSATDEFDHNIALAMLSAEHDALREIDEAISRIRNGSYGICEASGKLISAARLRAVPWTRFARAVEAQLEKAGEIRRPHLGSVGSIRGGPIGNLVPLKSAAATGSEEEEEGPADDEAGSEVEPGTRRHAPQGDTDDEYG